MVLRDDAQKSAPIGRLNLNIWNRSRDYANACSLISGAPIRVWLRTSARSEPNQKGARAPASSRQQYNDKRLALASQLVGASPNVPTVFACALK